MRKHKERPGLMALKQKWTWNIQLAWSIRWLTLDIGGGGDWQPTNHRRVCVFYMIKHMDGALNHPYLAWQTDSRKTYFTSPRTYWQEAFPFEKIKINCLKHRQDHYPW